MNVRLSVSCYRQLFENIVTKEEIVQNEQFLLFPQCFPLLVIAGYHRSFSIFLTKYVQSLLLQNCRMRERVMQSFPGLGLQVILKGLDYPRPFNRYVDFF